MARSELDIIINIQGNADKELRAVANAADDVGKRSSGLKNVLGTAFGVFTGGAILGGVSAAAGALGGLFSTAFDEATGAQDAMAQLNAVIASTGGAAGITAEQVMDLSSQLSAGNGLSKFADDAVLAGENLLLTFTNIGADVFPMATQAMVDMAEAMGTDPQAQAVALGKALNDPVAGITALTRVGVTFTDEQKNMIATMVETGDVAGAQTLILNELGKEFGGSAAAAAGTFSGQLLTVKEGFNGVLESAMNGALPGLQQVTAFMAGPEGRGAMQAFGEVLGTAVGGAIQWLAQTAIPWLTQEALPALQAVFTAVWPVIQNVVGTVYQFLSGVVWPWLRDVAFPWLMNTGLPALQAAFQAVWPVIQAAVAAVYQFLSTVVWPWLRDVAFPWLQNTALPALQAAFQVVWPIIQAAVNTVYVFLKDTVWPWLRDVAWPWIIGTALPALQAAWEAVWPKIQFAVNTVYIFMKETVWPWIFLAFGNLKTWIEDVRGVWDTKVSQIQAIVDRIHTAVENARKLVEGYIEQLKGYFTTGWDTVKATVQTTWDTIAGYISDPINTAKGIVSSAMAAITGFIQAGIDRVNDLIDAINSIPAVPDIPNIGGGGGGDGGGGSGGGGGGFSAFGATSAVMGAMAAAAGGLPSVPFPGGGNTNLPTVPWNGGWGGGPSPVRPPWRPGQSPVRPPGTTSPSTPSAGGGGGGGSGGMVTTPVAPGSPYDPTWWDKPRATPLSFDNPLGYYDELPPWLTALVAAIQPSMNVTINKAQGDETSVINDFRLAYLTLSGAR